MLYALRIGGRLCGAHPPASRPVVDAAIDYHSDRDGPLRDRPRIHPDDLGGDVARAKRTDRAEARRKYRAYLQAQQDAEAAEAESSGSAAAAPSSKPAGGRDQKPQPVAQPGVRMGMFAAARAAYRTPHYRDDLRNIRSLVLGSNAVWPVLVVCLATGAYSVVRINAGAGDTDPILPALFQFVFYPVPLLPPMLAGFLAPRSSWLAGLISAFISTMTLVGVFAMTKIAVPDSTASITTTSLLTLTVILLSQSLAFGFLIGALSGWYKRFLNLTSGARSRPPSKSGGGRSPQRRRPAARG